ncbi:MAG: hypothetical protein J3K34DRAFT_418369 [Monoraphidium minutum]|nr:MAG: hypothetical protein J3K34DRAFT_418369 [Monoraphidium minutum]
MLEECGAIRSGDSYRAVRNLLRDDPRWTAVPDEEAREELFTAFMRGFSRREEERERARKREREAAFKELLRGKGLAPTSQFRRVAPALEGVPAYEALERGERLRIFEVGVFLHPLHSPLVLRGRLPPVFQNTRACTSLPYTHTIQMRV